VNILLCRLSLSNNHTKATFFNQFRSFFIFRSDTASTPPRRRSVVCAAERSTKRQRTNGLAIGRWVQGHACLRRRHATRSPYLRIHRYHHLHPSHHRPSHSAPSSTKPTALANDTTTPTLQSHTAVPPPSPRLVCHTPTLDHAYYRRITRKTQRTTRGGTSKKPSP
jgi:hypothetical protein